MKKNNLLTMSNKFESLSTQLNGLSSNLVTLVAAGIILTLGVMSFQKNMEAKMPEVKSVAWYAANQKEARATNKECFDSQQLQATENCINSLHALEISYKGSNT
ncbi:MAG: EexN family lipoprotein [Methylococcales bacterium]|nr:EexN family lipoprotein [Methylococcales bacterium]